MSGPQAIGVDLGGTKMLVGVLDAGGRVVHRRSSRVDDLGEGELLDLLDAELRDALDACPEAEAIGLGVPCTIDMASGVCIAAANLPLRDQPLRDDVAERFGLPVHLDNDANAAAVAEHRHGAARGARNVVMLTIGTGIGGGLILEGRPYRGSTGAGAELGHVVVDIDGPRCQGNCPNRGCIEALASGTALAREARAAAAGSPKSRLAAVAAEAELDGRMVCELAHGGDASAREVLELTGRRLGAALSGLANSFDPDVIVVGGGVTAGAGELLLAPAREELRSRALPPQNETPVRAAALGADAGMIGAAALAAELAEGAA